MTVGSVVVVDDDEVVDEVEIVEFLSVASLGVLGSPFVALNLAVGGGTNMGREEDEGFGG